MNALHTVRVRNIPKQTKLKDKSLLNLHVKFGKLLAIVPENSYSILYVTIIMVLMEIGILYYGIGTLVRTLRYFSVIEEVLLISELGMICLLFLGFWVINVRSSEYMEEFWRNLTKFDENIGVISVKDSKDTLKSKLYFSLRILAALAALIIPEYFHYRSTKFSITDTDFPVLITAFYELNVVMIVWETCSLLESRFIFLERQLKTIILAKDNQKIKYQVQSIKSQYNILYRIVGNFEVGYSFVLFICLMQNTVFVLFVFGDVVSTKDGLVVQRSTLNMALFIVSICLF